MRVSLAGFIQCSRLSIWQKQQALRLQSTLELPKANLQYAFLDNKDNIIYLRLSSIMARENYKYCYNNQWANALNDISLYYKSIGKEMPQDMNDAVNNIPSFSEEFAKMLKHMKKKASEYLIIDIRGNSGGWTPITRPSLIMMFGDDYYSKDFGVKNIRLISDLYLKKINRTIEQLNKS